MSAFNLLYDKQSTGFGAVVPTPSDQARFDNLRSFQVQVQGVAPVSAMVRVYGANEASAPILIATVTLSSAGSSYSEVFQDDQPFEFHQAEVVSVSAGGKVSVVGSI